MIKRPLCMGAAVLVVILFCMIQFGASEVTPPDIKIATKVYGQVEKREITSTGACLYLKNFSDTNTLQSTESGSYQILVYLKNPNSITQFKIGSQIQVTGIFQLPSVPANPGQFNARLYYAARKVLLLVYDAEAVVLEERNNFWRSFLEDLKNNLQLSYIRILGEEDAAVLSAISLGSKNLLPAKIKKLYQEGGIAHILAISSLHITLIGMSIWKLLRRLGTPFWAAGLLSGSFLFAFCIMTGMSVSAMRACIMFFLWLGSQITGRTFDRPTAIALSGSIILLQSPNYLFDCAFLLSYGCILSLTFLMPLCKTLIPFPEQCKTGQAMQAGLALWLGTTPIVMYFFYQITPYSILLNLLVVPLMSVLMATGLLGGVIGLISIPLGTLIGAPCHYLLALFQILCRAEKLLPNAVWITGRPAAGQMILYYGLLLLAVLLTAKEGWLASFMEKRSARAASYILIGTAAVVLLWRTPPAFRMTFLDVGQGDCILMEAGDFTALVDGGSSSVKNVWSSRIESTLKCYGVSELDYVFLTHGDQDHINGVTQLFESYDLNLWHQNIGGITVKHLVCSEVSDTDEKLKKIKQEAEKLGIVTGTMVRGGSIETGDLSLTCLGPSGEVASDDTNAESLVLFLTYQKFTALLTGDLEQEGETQLITYLKMIEATENMEVRKIIEEQKAPENAFRGHITLLKVAHHGSKNSTSQELLELLKPEISIISCGKDNRYGHPHSELLERLEEAGSTICRTDQTGAVIVCQEGDQIRYGEFAN